MQILILAHRLPYPPNKGERIRTYHQIEFLRRQGHRIVVYAVLQDEQERAQAAELARTLDIEVVAEVASLRRLRLLAGLFSTHTLSVCNFRVPRLQARFNAGLQHSRPAAVLCTGSAMAAYVFASSPGTGEGPAPPALIMDFMDLDSDKWAQYARHSRWLMRLLYRREAYLLARYEHRINAHFSRCLFVSGNEVDLFLASRPPHPERVSVVGNGVDHECFRPSDPPASTAAVAASAVSPDMVFIGVMDYRPNEDAVSWFIESAWERVRQRWPDARFTVVGMSPSERVRQLERFAGVTVTGQVDTVLPYLHRANLFLAPFRMARGLQNKVLQAFSAGVPVITSRSGAEGIDCHDGEHLLLAETADDYLQAIERLTDTPELYRSLRQNALELVRKRYSWDGQNQALLACLPDPDAEADPEAGPEHAPGRTPGRGGALEHRS